MRSPVNYVIILECRSGTKFILTIALLCDTPTPAPAIGSSMTKEEENYVNACKKKRTD